MKFVPRHNQAIGRVITKRIMSTIIRPDETRNTTKFVLIDGVGPGAAAAGIKLGDIVLPSMMANISLDGGVSFRPLLDEKDIRAFVTGIPLDEFVVQTDSASHFVPFGDKDAAKSLCESGVSNGGAPLAEARL